MQSQAMHFKARAGDKLADRRLQANLTQARAKFVEGRARAVAEYEAQPGADFAALRDAGARIRDRVLENLDVWLETFEARAQARGAEVLYARDGEEIGRLVVEIARRHGVRKAVKSKSMLSEEAGLNDALAAAGITPVETDLGEYILQINDNEAPSHIIAPVFHKSKEEVAELFARTHGTPRKTDIGEMTREARTARALPVGRHGRQRRELPDRRNGLRRARDERGQRPHGDDAAQGARRRHRHREDRADARGLLDADAAAAALGDRPAHLELRVAADRGAGRRRGGRPRASVLHPRRQRPREPRRHRVPADAALHPLRCVHEPLSGVPERRRPRLRLGLSRPDGLGADAALHRHRERARPASGLDAVQPVRQRLSGEDSAARAAARAARKTDGARTAAVARAARPATVGRARRAARFLLRRTRGADRLRALPFMRAWSAQRDLPAPEGRTFRELYAARANRRGGPSRNME